MDTDAAFMQQVDLVERDLGMRGKANAGRVSEGVPPALATRAMEPSPEPAPAPAPVRARAPAPALTPAPAPALAPAPAPATPDRSTFSPSMQLSSPAVAIQPRSMDQDSSMVEVLLEQQKLMHEREEKLRQEFKAEATELRQAAQSERAAMEDKMTAIEQKLTPTEAVSEEQLAALQARLEALHRSKMLTDDELYAFEDISADYLEFKSSVGVVTSASVQANPAAWKLPKLVALSEGMASNGAFARQARRKYAA